MEANEANAVVTPAPLGASLAVTVTCHTVRRPGDRGRRHLLIVNPDWSVEVPHDLAAERVAAALGGYLSCLDFIDDGIPALRQWLIRTSRACLPPICFQSRSKRWTLSESAECCPRTGFPDAVSAAEHWRTIRHIAAAKGAPTRQLRMLATASGKAHDAAGTLAMPPGDRTLAAAACLKGTSDVDWLWDAGVHPRLVWQAHRTVGANRPLPARFYLGLACNRPDLNWIAATISGRSEPEGWLRRGIPDQERHTGPEPLICWLAWSVADWDIADPTARGRWLDCGISRSAIVVLGEAGYHPEDVAVHAHAIGRTPDGAARVIRDWVLAGFRPDTASLTELSATGAPTLSAPSPSAVDRLQVACAVLGEQFSRTELALLLAEHGTVAHALAAIRSGARPC